MPSPSGRDSELRQGCPPLSGDEPVEESHLFVENLGTLGDEVWIDKPNLWTKHIGVTTTSRGATVERTRMFRKSAAPACCELFCKGIAGRPRSGRGTPPPARSVGAQYLAGHQ